MKRLKKVGVVLLISTLVITGASAWLSASKTGLNSNNITSGNLEIRFDNQVDTIELLDTFPMTSEYAKEHLTPYTFSIINNGDVAMDYKLFTQRFWSNAAIPYVKILFGKENELGEYVWTECIYNELLEEMVSDGYDGGTLNPKESHKYKMIVHLGEELNYPEETTLILKFKLKLKATQHVEMSKMTLSKNWDQSGVNKDLIRSINITKTAPSTFDKEWDASALNNGLIKGYLKDNEIYLVSEENISLPRDSSWLFMDYGSVHAINGLETVDTSSVINMRGLFAGTGSKSNRFIMDVSNWKTGSVQDFSNMFCRTGYHAEEVLIGDISNWDVGNGKDFNFMFRQFYNSKPEANLDLSKWNVSSGETFTQMFYEFGHNSHKVNLNLSGWNLARAYTLEGMFQRLGINAPLVNINASGWNSSGVQNMATIFESAALNSDEVNIDFSGSDTTGVRSMSGAFYGFAHNAIEINGSFNIFSPDVDVIDIFIQSGWNATSGKFKINYTPESKNKVLEAFEYCLRDDIFVLGDEIIR